MTALRNDASYSGRHPAIVTKILGNGCFEVRFHRDRKLAVVKKPDLQKFERRRRV